MRPGAVKFWHSWVSRPGSLGYILSCLKVSKCTFLCHVLQIWWCVTKPYLQPPSRKSMTLFWLHRTLKQRVVYEIWEIPENFFPWHTIHIIPSLWAMCWPQHIYSERYYGLYLMLFTAAWYWCLFKQVWRYTQYLSCCNSMFNYYHNYVIFLYIIVLLRYPQSVVAITTITIVNITQQDRNFVL